MRERMRKALGFLGLIEDEYGDYAPATSTRPFSDQGEFEEPEWAPPPSTSAPRPFPVSTGGARPVPTSGPRPLAVTRSAPEAPRLRPAPSARVRTLAGPLEEELAIVFPVNYDDSRRLTDLLRSHRPVLLNVTDLEPDVARRVVDFAAGTIYAFRAKIEPLAAGVYLMYREETDIPADVRVRLRATNFRSLGPR
jgi:cell division inhibitor SepF